MEEQILQIIGKIQENIGQLNHDYTNMSVEVAKIQTDVMWLKQALYVLIIPSVAGAVAAIWNLIINSKNKKQ